MQASTQYRPPGKSVDSQGRDKENQPDNKPRPVDRRCERWQPEALVGIQDARKQTAGTEDGGCDQKDPEQVGSQKLVSCRIVWGEQPGDLGGEKRRNEAERGE